MSRLDEAPHSAGRPFAQQVGLCAVVATLVGCGGDAAAPEPPLPRLSATAALGEQIFHDRTLSASGRLSCADCHVASAGHAQGNGLAAQLGGPGLTLQGSRTSPSLRYLAAAPPFRLSSSGAPEGGLFWDGRASTLADQAGRPFFNPREMALTDARDLASRLAAAPYSAAFRQVFGADVFSRADDTLEHVKQALQRYQQEDASFAPFSSPYDNYLRGRGSLSAAAQRGLAVFNSATHGNCASCHPSAKNPDGSLPLFTDFSYHALGVPRNPALRANADPAHFDLGLCAREGGDLLSRTDLCGSFRVPSLRNAALRQAFFHNGRFTTLREVVAFYARRDSHPQEFYPRRADGSIDLFDDLPEALRGNVLRGLVPYGRAAGEPARLSEAEIDDVVAFLEALTDAPAPTP